MDRFIAGFQGWRDHDLVLCVEHGVAYQPDMSERVPYDEAYFDKCAGYEDQEIALKINAGRIALVDKHSGAGAVVLDVGIGAGEFIKKRAGLTFGFDINPKAVEWLEKEGLFGKPSEGFTDFTFWDVIEHVENPEEYFEHVPVGGYLFTSLPIFPSLYSIRESRHFRPGEHLYYWTETGFVRWMALYGFKLLERDDFETQAGRESILSFAFQRGANA